MLTWIENERKVFELEESTVGAKRGTFAIRSRVSDRHHDFS